MSGKIQGRLHTESSARKTVSTSGANVDQSKKTIELGKHQGVGIKTWGCIDYLRGQCHYRVIRQQ